MIKIKQKGDFKKTIRFLDRVGALSIDDIIKKYADEGIEALKSATPVDTGKTSKSWYYEITRDGNGVKIEYKNSNIVDGVPIALIIQYGHGTRNGGYVEGIDYINPTIQPIFDKMSNSLWKELSKD